MADVKNGGITMIPIEGGKYHVWTKHIGNGPIHMLTLHGGPGCTHEYMECFEDFLPQHGIRFYYYDQLGSHYSDQPDDPALWTVARFCDEVEQVRARLGLDSFYLFGHSWGGMLGIEYALKYPHHLNGLVISNMTASIASYVESINQIRNELPAEDLRILEKYEAKGEYNAPEYEQTMYRRVYARCICRLDPWPEPVARMFRHMNQQVYNTMQGPNEFVITGNFKDWNRWNDLARISVATLVIGAQYDTMPADDIRRMGALIPDSRVAICERGSHLAMYDDQEAYFRHLAHFILDVEGGRPL
jgi:proline iminopeptidase